MPSPESPHGPRSKTRPRPIGYKAHPKERDPVRLEKADPATQTFNPFTSEYVTLNLKPTHF
ncbi:hypothetical protein BDD12DRAFT_880570 [Trichophaea hybrida]|nr:hypothetical protein BDD12DRAFT_880570 [Trichophaea hybrida]